MFQTLLFSVKVNKTFSNHLLLFSSVYYKSSSNIEKGSKFLGITDIGIFEQLSGLLICSGEQSAILLLVVPAGLLLVHLDHIVLLHLQCLLSKLQDSAPKCLYLRSLVVVDPAAVKQEPEGGDGDADPLAVGLLELPHLCGLLHSEVDLVTVLS